MIIDFEHHFLPKELFVRAGGQEGKVVTVMDGETQRTTLHDYLHRLDYHIRDMDTAGIDIAVISAAGPFEGLDDCKAINSAFAEIMRANRDRIVALSHVPALGGKLALDELDRAITELGLRGVSIRCQVEGLFLDSPKLHPFWEKVAKLDTPVFVHVATVPAGYQALQAPYDLSRSLGREFDLLNATVRLIVSGVLEEFPELNIVLAHMGGGISAIRERILMRGYGGLTDVMNRMKRSFDEYLSRLYFDMAGFEGGINAVKCALTTLSPKQLLFATDYPQNFTGDGEGMRKYIENIKELPLSAKDKEDMLGGNAAKLLKL